MDREELSLSQGSKGPSCLKIIWEDKCHHSKHAPLPPLYTLSMMSYGMECCQGHLWLTVVAVSPPNLLCTPSLPAGGLGWEAEKASEGLQAQLSNNKNIFILKTLFSAPTQIITSYQLLWRKLSQSKLVPSFSKGKTANAWTWFCDNFCQTLWLLQWLLVSLVMLLPGD